MPSSNPRYANWSARAALRKHMASTPRRCWICGMGIDPSLPARHPYALELDELTPVSKGGSPVDPANIAAAHRCCNQWRGDKPVPYVRKVAAAARSAFGGWRSPAEFVMFARNVRARSGGAKRANAAQPAPSGRW